MSDLVRNPPFLLSSSVFFCLCLLAASFSFGLLPGDGLGQCHHAANGDFECFKTDVITTLPHSLRGILSDLFISLPHGNSVVVLPLLKSQLDGKGLSLPPALTLHRGFELPLFGGQRLSVPAFFGCEFLAMPLVGGGSLSPAVEDQDERTNRSGKNATDEGGSKDGVCEELLDFWSHDWLVMYAKLFVAAIVLGVIGGVLP